MRGFAHGGLTESVRFVAAEEFAQGRRQDIAVGVRVRFVVTAGQHLSVGRDNHPTPHAETTLAQWPTVIFTVLSLYIPAVLGVGRHQGMAVLVVV